MKNAFRTMHDVIDSDVISSFLSMRTVLAAVMQGKQM